MALVAVALSVCACGGGADDANPGTVPQPAGSGPVEVGPGWRVATPDDFAALVSRPDVVTVNVHIPDEGQIAGTDLLIPYDDIAGYAAALPPDKSTPLAVYCRSARMSTEAIPQIAALGYGDITELGGGFFAWESTGRPLDPAGSIPPTPKP